MGIQLHNPLEGLTPLQISTATDRRARLVRLRHTPIREVVKAIVEVEPEPIEEVVPELPPMKPLWFGIVKEIRGSHPLMSDIQQIVADHYGITRDDIISSRRNNRLVGPRQIAVYLCKVLTIKSFPQIGRATGNRDHTTMLYSVAKIERLLKTDAALGITIAALIEKICPKDESNA